MNYTSIEQSKQLLKLGIDPETADMVYVSYGFDGPPANGDEKLPTTFEDPDSNHWYFVDFMEPFYKDDWANDGKYPNIPCWSVGQLITLLPKSDFEDYLVWFRPQKNGYAIFYKDVITIIRDNVVEAFVDMIDWLKKENLM